MLTSTALLEKGRPVWIFTRKYREGKKLIMVKVENEKLIHTNISPMNIQRCNWKEERKNQKVQTAAPGHQEKKLKIKTVKQQKKQNR